jgi:hypothetical protein
LAIPLEFGEEFGSSDVIGDLDLRGAAIRAKAAFDAFERLEHLDCVLIHGFDRVHDLNRLEMDWAREDAATASDAVILFALIMVEDDDRGDGLRADAVIRWD